MFQIASRPSSEPKTPQNLFREPQGPHFLKQFRNFSPKLVPKSTNFRNKNIQNLIKIGSGQIPNPLRSPRPLRNSSGSLRDSFLSLQGFIFHHFLNLSLCLSVTLSLSLYIYIYISMPKNNHYNPKRKKQNALVAPFKERTMLVHMQAESISSWV